MITLSTRSTRHLRKKLQPIYTERTMPTKHHRQTRSSLCHNAGGPRPGHQWGMETCGHHSQPHSRLIASSGELQWSFLVAPEVFHAAPGIAGCAIERRRVPEERKGRQCGRRAWDEEILSGNSVAVLGLTAIQKVAKLDCNPTYTIDDHIPLLFRDKLNEFCNSPPKRRDRHSLKLVCVSRFAVFAPMVRSALYLKLP